MLLKLLVCGVALLGCAAAMDPKPECTPVTPVKIDLEAWTQHSWYVQAQQINDYQPISELYCVTATYNLEGASVPFFGGTVISVYNRATYSDYVDTGNSGTLCGRVARMTGELSVAPCFLPNLFSGPYWPIALEEVEGEYTMAAVSGGQPNDLLGFENGSPLCTTSLTSTNGAGLWIFSRDPVPPAGAVERMKAKLTALGFGTNLLIDVPQGAVCEDAYASRFLKPRDCGETACNPASTAHPGWMSSCA